MIIEFHFNSRSSGQDVPEAIRIAKQHGGYIEDKFYKIKFDNPEHNDLKKLYELVGHLKGSAIILGEGEPIRPNKFFRAINCPDKLLCNGVCKHVIFGYYDLQTFIEKFSGNIENGVLTSFEEQIISRLTEFLEIIEENRFKINKKLFLDYFLRETEMEKQFCSKYSFDKTKKEIENLPSEIKIIPYEESAEFRQRYEEEELEFNQVIETILTHCEISSNFSPKEIQECANSVVYLASAKIFTLLEDTDILISALPKLKLFILAKIALIEDLDQEKEDEEEDSQYLITKEDDYFCASNSALKLYFRIFSEGDDFKGYFEKLKKIGE